MVKNFLEANFKEDEILTISKIMSEVNFNTDSGEAPLYLSSKLLKLNERGHSWIDIFQTVVDCDEVIQEYFSKIDLNNTRYRINSLCCIIKNRLDAEKMTQQIVPFRMN